MPSDPEAGALLTKDEVTLMGLTITPVKEIVHFCFVFKVDPKDKTKELPEPEALWKKIFTGVEDTGKAPPEIKKGVTQAKFNDAVFKEFVSILTGKHCGFKVGKRDSIDGDEVLLTVTLEDAQALTELADFEGFRARLKPEAYEGAKVECPTEYAKGHGKFDRERDEFYQTDNYQPAHVNYTKGLQVAGKIADFYHCDVARLVRRRMQTFTNLNGFVNSGACVKFFCTHRWDDLEVLYKKRWNDPTSLIYWPRDNIADIVLPYFGAETAFMFHWLNAFTKALAAPAAISLVTFAARESGILTVEQKHIMSIAFAVLLALWSSMFVSTYEQAKNLKVLKWGMTNYNDALAMVRKQFSDEYRGSCKELLQNLVHWGLCVVFILETIGVSGLISSSRHEAHHNPEGTTMGLSNVTYVLLSKYLITVNIKVVDKLWSFISVWLTEQENHRTVQDMKENMVTKLFIVKSMVFYWPFAYIILIKPYEIGCTPLPGLGEDPMQGCVVELQASLLVFWVTQLVTELGLMMVQLFLTRRAVKQEMDLHPERPYTYLEVQAKCAEYTTSDEIADFMNQVLSFGFIVLFGVTLPFTSCMAFLYNLPAKRLLAYKMSYTMTPPIARGAEGIGSWSTIIYVLSHLGVLMSGYISIFAYTPLNELPLSTKALLFIAVEHAFILIKFAIEAAFGTKSTAQLRIEEHHQDNVEVVLYTAQANASKIVNISPKHTAPASPYA